MTQNPATTTALSSVMRERVGEWVNSVLAQEGWTVTEFARRADVSRAMVSELSNMNPGSAPTLTTMVKLVSATNAPPPNLWGTNLWGGAPGGADPEAVDIEVNLTGAVDVPGYRLKRDEVGDYHLNARSLFNVFRPPSLAGHPEAFAVYLDETINEMLPAGALVYFRHKAAANGDLALVICEDGCVGFGTMNDRDDRVTLTLGAEIFSWPADKVKQIFTIGAVVMT